MRALRLAIHAKPLWPSVFDNCVVLTRVLGAYDLRRGSVYFLSKFSTGRVRPAGGGGLGERVGNGLTGVKCVLDDVMPFPVQCNVGAYLVGHAVMPLNWGLYAGGVGTYNAAVIGRRRRMLSIRSLETHGLLQYIYNITPGLLSFTLFTLMIFPTSFNGTHATDRWENYMPCRVLQ